METQTTNKNINETTKQTHPNQKENRNNMTRGQQTTQTTTNNIHLKQIKQNK